MPRSTRSSRLVGTGVASEILIEGRIFNGREAYEKGLLSRVVPDAEVEAEAMALARRIAEGSPLSARFHKAALRRLRGTCRSRRRRSRRPATSPRPRISTTPARAFLAKQKPAWQGR